MKHSFTAALAALTLAFAPQQAEAQFFKKLGKALEDVSKTVDKVLDTGSETASTGQQTAADGTKVTCNLKDFTLKYKGVTWYKEFCGVDMMLTYNGEKAERVYYFDKMKVVGADGTQLQARSYVGGNITSLGNGDFDFEPGVPVKVTFALFDMPRGGTKLSLCQMRTQQHTPTGGYQDRYIELRNVVVPPMPTAGKAKSGPFKGVWTLRGNGVEGKLTLDFYGKSIDGMDAMGNEMKCYGTIYVAYGQKVDDCPITAWEANGNTATVTYIGGRDGNTYSSVLTLDAQAGMVTVSGTRVLKDEGMGDCYVSDGLVFKRQ